MATKKPKIVYLCTKGDYSDYSIYGAFSTKTKAEAFWRHWVGPDSEPDWDDHQIEEYVLDEPHKGGYYCWNFGFAKNPIWEPNLVPRGAKVTWMDNGVPQVYGDGPTPEHARRSRDEMLRAIKAGTVVNPNAARVLAHQKAREEHDKLQAQMTNDIATFLKEHPEAV